MAKNNVNIRQRLPRPPKGIGTSLFGYLSELTRIIEKVFLHLSITKQEVDAIPKSITEDTDAVKVDKPIQLTPIDIGWDGSYTATGYSATGPLNSIAFDQQAGLITWLFDPNTPYQLEVKKVGQSSGPPPYSGTIDLSTASTITVSGGLIISVS